MARKAKPSGEAHRRQTEAWRTRMRSQGRPEACRVDVALAAALAVAMDDEAAAGAQTISPQTRAIFASAVAFLEDRGFDKVEAKRKIFDRVRKRRDLPRLRELARPITKGHANV